MQYIELYLRYLQNVDSNWVNIKKKINKIIIIQFYNYMKYNFKRFSQFIKETLCSSKIIVVILIDVISAVRKIWQLHN